jgi:uncharacterized protein YjdB
MLIEGKERLQTIPEPDDAELTPNITLAGHVITLTEDETFELGASVVPAGQTVTWTSTSSSVATVTDGVITAEGAGNTVIMASITVDGVTYTDTATVIVTE